MILKIRKTKDPILREPVEEVVDFDHEFQFLIDNMVETMRKDKGVGLAAPQVGISKKFFISEYEGDDESKLSAFPLTVICNPKIVKKSENEINMVEGCLSFPGLELLIKRPEKVTVEGLDRYGKPITIEAGGLQSRVIQHENDHLNSTLLIDHIQETSIIFIGTGSLGAKALEMLASDIQYKIVSVITSENTKVTSRNRINENPIEQIAKKFKLPVVKTANINNEKIVAEIKKLAPQLGVMADFGQIISEKVLSIPEHGIINIHPSILPKYRGSSPIQNTILSGDKEAGVSLILTSKKMDAGPIISQSTVEISPSETFDTLKKLLSEIGAVLLLNSIPYYLAGDLEPETQNENEASYTKIIQSVEALVDSKTRGIDVERKVRAFSQWPKVYTLVNGKRVQITSAYLDQDENLIISRVKPEGKNEMNYEDFVRGYKTKLTFDA